MKVKLSSEARQDIDHQVAYLTGKTNSGIVTFRNIISRAPRLLSDQPYVGQTAAEIPIRGARRAIIDGWNEGIPGMRAGGARKLVVPPELGFGSAGKRPVPPNAVLVFYLEILAEGS